MLDGHSSVSARRRLPNNTPQNVSMQPGKRVVLMCVGGKDSYAVFEAANDDAAAVLYVGEGIRRNYSSDGFVVGSLFNN